MPAMTNPQASIVITGCGWVTPYAHGRLDDVLNAPRPAVARETGFDAVSDDTPLAFPQLTEEIRTEKGAWLAAIALEHALREARLQPATMDHTKIGLVLGSALAGQIGMIDFANEVRGQSARFVSPIHFPQTVGNYLAGALSRGYHIRGSNLTIANGAASGLDAILEAAGLLAAGGVDVVFAGGVECLADVVVAAPTGSGPRPSEGACMFVLERQAEAAARGVTPRAVLLTLDPTTASPAIDLRSTAGPTDLISGAVAIESWIGAAGAASGAAAVAAAIGAAQGMSVPVRAANGAVNPSKLDDASMDSACEVRAVGDGGSESRLLILVPPTAK
jgi:3-oxoacyl-[acyl-carrier-protein] synthase II